MEVSKKHREEIKSILPTAKQQNFVDNAIESALKRIRKEKVRGDIEIYTDGGSRGNPGPSGGGFAIYKRGELIEKGSEYYGIKTNNQAEYLALRSALREAYKPLAEEPIQCFLDSKLVVEQMNGNFKVKSPNVKPLFEEIRRIADQFKSISFAYIPRAQNSVADRLANEAMDRKK